MNSCGTEAEYLYPSGDRYRGNWLNGKKHGYGVAEFVSGNRYDGHWDSDFKHGKGTIFFVDGTTYKGDWCKDHKHGFGEARFASGNRYVGEWIDDAMEGQGDFFYARGDHYKGEWKRGKISGFGTWTSFDGSSRYEGGWLDGLRHGTGTLTENGREVEVEYRLGHLTTEAEGLDVVESKEKPKKKKKKKKKLNDEPQLLPEVQTAPKRSFLPQLGKSNATVSAQDERASLLPSALGSSVDPGGRKLPSLLRSGLKAATLEPL
eukprot:NODE_3967_length_887_cov_138.256563_g3655_i0.p1 GENE.NODE_3967_length_887_cov_138.256563_g3655_i0~~NODE_3967_length_887_cov_138.256563_g3655_i0.p1  ORF type:complete len:284 (-),score=43.56 NODE_3967_length_887_cov_138.256563_g3655_i0:35-820(-)